MPVIYIDNKPYEVKPGRNLLETCLSLGFDLPYFCWHPALGSVGACRQCAVKSFRDENDKKGRLVMSCMEAVADNQRISIVDPEATEFRENVIGWLMTNHPHDCAVCDEGGACHLQDMTVMTGHAHRKFEFNKRTYKNQYLGPFINHEMNRCIQCYRCVRFYKDYAGGKDLDVFASRNRVYFGRHEDGVLENEFSGNLSEICPTGVFTDKTLKQHYTRKWDLTMAPSICQHCSLGCNIIGGERYGSLRVIMNRYNSEVNGYFLCDRGRFGYEYVNSQKRILEPTLNNQVIAPDMVITEVSELFKEDVIGIGSARASVESNYALKKLVGDENFYSGASAKEQALTKLAKDMLMKTHVRALSLKEVEECDAILILGEDVTNTAPMLALTVRQAVRQPSLKDAASANIPEWNDAAVRTLAQDKKGALFIVNTSTTKLNDAATASWNTSPNQIAKLGFSIAAGLGAGSSLVKAMSEEEKGLVDQIVKALGEAERPAIIAGSFSLDENIMKSALNIAEALHQKNKNTGIVLTLPECNSLGLEILGGKPLEDALLVRNRSVIILENDLYRHGEVNLVDQFLGSCKQVVVMDHLENNTVKKANLRIPAGTFAESDGIHVNNEGRAQRFVQVHQPRNLVMESWRWLMYLNSEVRGIPWKNHDDVLISISREIALMENIVNVSPTADFKVAGQKIPRQPHRYSGRTAMLANINVSEPKPSEDEDSPLSYTMEGLRGLPPSALVPFFWSPGWNSVQSTAKYQEEVGGRLRGGDPGLRLINPSLNGQGKYYEFAEGIKEQTGKLIAVPLYHIFGSDELSSNSPGVAERSPAPYVMLNDHDALEHKMKEGEPFKFRIENKGYELPVKISTGLAKGLIGIPMGLPGIGFINLPSVVDY